MLDLIHLHPGADAPEFLRELRLQNLERMNVEELRRQAEHIGKPKLRRVAAFVGELAAEELQDFEVL